MPHDDHYFRVPDAVSEGGVQGAIWRGHKNVPLSALLYHITEATSCLGKADRVHLFVMLCGGGSKVDSDEIVDVRFDYSGGELRVMVKYPRSSRGVTFKVVTNDDCASSS